MSRRHMRSSQAAISTIAPAQVGLATTGIAEHGAGVHRISLTAFGAAIAAAEVFVVVLACVLCELAFHTLVHDELGSPLRAAQIGMLAAAVFALPGFWTNAYSADALMSVRRRQHVAKAWLGAVLILALSAFMAKSSTEYSRGAMLAFLATGFLGLIAVDTVARAGLVAGLRTGRIRRRRLFVVGSAREIREFEEQSGSLLGFRIAGTLALTGTIGSHSVHDEDALQEHISAGARLARELGADTIYLLPSCEQPHITKSCLAGFADLPASICLALPELLTSSRSVRIARVDGRAVLSLAEPALSPWENVVKRTFDVTAAICGLIALLPIFAIVAIAIKLDSRGPVFFRQRRRGFNQREFRIWKFRTMSTLEDGDVIRQAEAGDSRITRLGAILRRYNIDELPQLINVLAGDMSIVGPRPHAVAHDRLYERRIASYSRRLNMRPGLTGWAQINGLRGATDTDSKMEARVEHDIHYIENWSLTLDLYIIAMTVLSPKAFRNAL